MTFMDRRYRNEPTDDDVQVAEDGLQRVRNDLATRRRSIEQIEAARVFFSSESCITVL